MNYPDNQKVNYAVFMLVRETEYWWDSTRRLLEGGGIIITWEVFRDKFFENYFPNDVKRVKEIKFMQLKQGNMIKAAQNNDLIQGKCFIKEKTLNVLYDSGATHSFISNDCVQHFQLSVSSLETNLIVLTPTNKSVVANKVCLDCPLFINDRKFLVNLICLPLSQLDVILGMDWLSSNHVLLNYAEKSVMFSNSKDLSISLSKPISKFSWGKVQGYLILSSMEAKEDSVFLGLAGYYRRFIEELSEIVMSLTQLTKKRQSFEWTEKCENSFQELKKRLTTTPVLALPNPNGQFVIFCDA
uniref:Reverse transcriptase/retrotransposon-derived protein RNase H-like domain-containing protein n=2 Tax=Cajanus cajan TaxID=3821 RepID=A0A151SXW8_CAJCA|nr:hypothetical protein KK1_015078 [Cajanus cajan]